MGQRDLQARGRGETGGDAGNDLDADAGARKRSKLLAATAEDEGIAAFQPHHGLAGAMPAQPGAH